jgi:hypothetical protein
VVHFAGKQLRITEAAVTVQCNICVNEWRKIMKTHNHTAETGLDLCDRNVSEYKWNCIINTHLLLEMVAML